MNQDNSLETIQTVNASNFANTNIIVDDEEQKYSSPSKAAAKGMENSSMAPLQIKFQNLDKIEKLGKKNMSPSKFTKIKGENVGDLRDNLAMEDPLPQRVNQGASMASLRSIH
jgi:hypothetical protein